MTSRRITPRQVAARRTVAAALAAGCACVAAATTARAQVLRPPMRSTCNGQTVSRIDVHTYPPFEPGGPRSVARLARLATSLHATTHESIIRRYLKLHVGEPCTDFLRRESERILRAQPFIADADVVTSTDEAGNLIVEVTTIDEPSLIVGGSASGHAPHVRGVRLGEANLGGEAIYAMGSWQAGTLYRDVFHARVVDYQFLGNPYQFMLQGTRNDVGGSWDAALMYPFLTDVQRLSWRATAGGSDGYFSFRHADGPRVSLPVSRSYADVGVVRALGPVGRTLLVGMSLSREREHTGVTPVILLDTAIAPDTTTALAGRYEEHRVTRANLLLGFRRVSFLRVTGFDAVEGAQDVRRGVQLSGLVGKGLHISDLDERGSLISGGVYAGAGDSTSFVATEVMGSRRRDVAATHPDGILLGGRLAWYVKPAPKHTAIADVEYGAGWRQRVPFQLTFSDREGGMLGFRHAELGGGRRVVTRVEDRYRLGHVRQFAAVALAGFVEGGKLWAGDVPFGVTTGVKLTAGVGVLAALPPRSRRTWRVDFATPLNDKRNGDFEIRFSNTEVTRWFWREPGDLQNGRERAIPSSVYNWP